MKRQKPNFQMRLGDEKESWVAAAKRDGFSKLATWIKWLVQNHISKK